MNLGGRSFLKLLDFTTEEIGELIELAADLKKKKRREYSIDFAKAKI